MEIITILKEYGLTDEEARLYLAGVKLGESSLSTLAQEASIKRTTAYLVATKLEEKGLMGKFKMRSGLRFVVTSPAKLEKLSQQKLENIRKIIPSLNLYSEKFQDTPEVSLFQGKEGYLSVFDDPLQYTNMDIRAMGSLQNVREVITSNYDEKYFVPKRLERKIGFRGLYFKTEIKDLRLTEEKNRLEKRKIRILPKQYFQPVFTMVYENTVIKFTSKKEMIALKIVSSEIAKSEIANFDMIWEMLDK